MDMKAPLTIALTCLLLCGGNARSEDSIPARQLGELVVTGDRCWIENGTVNVIPSRKEKKLSNSPASLIKSMHLPFLKEKDGTIVSLSGEPVSVFINGERAADIDISTFWPMEVRRVQYMESPADPRFEGARRVVNFIVEKYRLGGVIRFNGTQKVPDNGYYTAASKLAYRKMTYGVMVNGSYLRDHRTDSDVETRYTDIFYNGRKYDEITRNEESHAYTREEGVRAAFDAKYATQGMSIRHTLSLGWNRNPGSGSHSADSWSENLFGSNYSYDCNTLRSLSPQLSGNYYFILPKKWFLSAGWFYSYARNDNSSQDRTGYTDIVFNSTREDVHSGKIFILPSYMPSDKWLFQLRVDASLDRFSTRYGGSAVTRQAQSRQDITSFVNVSWSPSQKFSLSLKPGVAASMWQIGSIHGHTVSPTLSLSAYWDPSRKVSTGGSLKLYRRSPSASESNPVPVRNSELMWSLGNPCLKNLTSWDTYVYATYIPSNWLTMSLGLGYAKTFNGIISTYTPGPAETGGLVKENINARPKDSFRANLGFSGSFLDDNLSVSIDPQWYYTHFSGPYGKDLHCLTLSGSVDYTIGDFRLGVSYDGPYRDLSMGGMARDWKHDSWSATVEYGNGNLYIDLGVEDIFNNKARSREWFTSPNYSTVTHTWETGRKLTLNVTYTFGYGKKIDRSIDISGPEETKTSVANTH